MDFKKILAGFDAVENNTDIEAKNEATTKTDRGSMRAILESFYRADVEEAAKPDFLDIDKDGDKKESMKKAAKDKEEKEKTDESVEEELEEAIMVSAEGDEAVSLLQILQMAGISAPAPAPVAVSTPAPVGPGMDSPSAPLPALPEPEGDMDMDIEMQDEYSNSPDEFEQDIDAVIASGDDLHREKDQYASSALGDNPMKAFEGKFKAILDELLAEDDTAR